MLNLTENVAAAVLFPFLPPSHWLPSTSFISINQSHDSEKGHRIVLMKELCAQAVKCIAIRVAGI